MEGLTRILLRTFGPPAAIIGTNQAEMVLDGTTVRELLMELESCHESLRKLLHPHGEELSDLIYLLVNGRNVHGLDGLDTVISDGDVVSLLPVTAGG